MTARRVSTCALHASQQRPGGGTLKRCISGTVLLSLAVACRSLSLSPTMPLQRTMMPVAANGAMERQEKALVSFLTDDKAVNLFERIDDVVMGGVSSSTIRPSESGPAAWSGIVRIEGGGFCGTRTKPFAAPIDVSDFEGLYIDAALTSDAEPQTRAWKCTVRCSRERGEVVYTAEWRPGAATRSRTLIPFSEFRLVRGPRLVPDAPPLGKQDLARVFGFGLTCSKFAAPSSTDSATLVQNFRPGFFKVDLYEIGVYGSDKEPAKPLPAIGVTSRPNSASNPNLIFKLLRPISSIVFSEKRRRRDRARQLLVETRSSVSSKLQARIYGQRVVKRGIKALSPAAAIMEGLGELATDVCAALLELPLRLVFRAVFFAARLPRKFKTLLSSAFATSARSAAPSAS